jgi:hypothetical protein
MIRSPKAFVRFGSVQVGYGGVTEWPNVPVLKTGDLARGPRVQISPPPPTSLDKRETFSVSRRLWRCSARIARARSPYLSSYEAASRVLGRVSLSGPVAVPFDFCQWTAGSKDFPPATESFAHRSITSLPLTVREVSFYRVLT